MRFLPASAALVFSAISLSVQGSEVVEIDWKKVGVREVFSHEATIAESKLTEVCGSLKKGDVVKWRFSAAAPVEFNIHYHDGKRVEYLANSPSERSDENTFLAPIDQYYCWMWTNREKQPTNVSMNLSRGL